MKKLSESRTLYVAVAQTACSTLAATLTPGEDCPTWVVKVLAAIAAGLGVAVIALRVQDKKRYS